MTESAGPAARMVQADPGQAGEVLAVLDEAAAWLAGRGVRQWPPRFEPAWVDDALRRGETWLAVTGQSALATVTLTTTDPLWEAVPDGGPALYVHRLAVRRPAAGLGAVILRWAARRARAQALRSLRLDCVAGNARLRAYYEAAGFTCRGEAQVSGAPGQRTAPSRAQATVVARYELPLARRAAQ